MPGRTTVTQAARLAAADWRRLVRVSRPSSWIAAGLPFLLGVFDADRVASVSLVIGTVYFLGPFALLRNGLDDAVAGGADPGRPEAVATRFAIAVTNLPFLLVLVLLGGPAAGIALVLTVALAVAEATPPIRLRDRPVLDLVAAGLLFVLPAVCGLLVGGRAVADLPWTVLAAILAWGIGTASLASVRDMSRGAARMRNGGPPVSTASTLGARTTATVTLVAYLVAVALTATLGVMGILAAVGLALFLLLPPMILTAPPAAWSSPPSAGSAAPAAPANSAPALAIRAWRDLQGLAILCGAWLAILLLQAWGITTYDAWTAAIVVPTALTGYALANVVAIRIATRRHRVPSALQAPGVASLSVTIVVPCRDAVESLPACLTALRSQTYPDTDIVVVDDGSTDGSADEAAAWIGEDAVMDAPPRPDGWTSRDWACRVGADTATTDLVLFVDPNTVLAPVTARILVEQLQTRRDDLLVGLPRDAMPTPWERATVPGFALLRFGFEPIWWSATTGGRPAALAFGGPLVLVRREAYIATGGHAPDGADPGADTDLTRAFVRAGKRVGVARLAKLAATRQYRDGHEALAAWRRLILPYGGGWLAGAVTIVILEAVAFLVPSLLTPIAIVSAADPNIVAASLIPFLLVLAMRLALAITQRQSPRTIAWHPVTVLLALLGQLAGIADHARGRDGS